MIICLSIYLIQAKSYLSSQRGHTEHYRTLPNITCVFTITSITTITVSSRLVFSILRVHHVCLLSNVMLQANAHQKQ